MSIIFTIFTLLNNHKYMKIIIAGGRNFNDYELLDKEVSSILNSLVEVPMNNMIILSGGAKGADKLGERYSILNKLNLKKYPANWNKYGKSAGPIRNSKMAKVADILIAFWDGKSKGTKDMIDRMSDKQVYIINYE